MGGGRHFFDTHFPFDVPFFSQSPSFFVYSGTEHSFQRSHTAFVILFFAKVIHFWNMRSFSFEIWILVLCIIVNSYCNAIVIPRAGAGKMALTKACTTSSHESITPTSRISHSKPVRSPCVDCVNRPSNRQCWGKFNIDTDYYQTTPDTGITREVWKYISLVL